MLAIPIPFVVSMLLGLLAITLYIRLPDQAKVACFFLGLCTVMTAMVGLRWTFELRYLNIAQPILASMIPVVAWYTFVYASREQGFFPIKHYIAPLFVIASFLIKPWFTLPLDVGLTLIYVGYGIALVRFSGKEISLINVSLGNWEGVKKAEVLAGWMMILSGGVDAFISLDFIFNQGELSLYVLTAAYLIILPVLSIAVVVIGINTPVFEEATSEKINSDNSTGELVMTKERAQEITTMLDVRVRHESLYLDPELTLSKLTRKLGIPAKQISIAVNQVHGQNISKVINRYRIEHAKHSLITSQDSITKIFMNSGFQTKSNFNREFLSMTGMTPSEYKRIR